MPRFDVTTIGEGQLRYSVPAGHRLEEVDQLEVHACGTEANVVALLSRLGWHCGWFSSLPNTPLGRRIANHFRISGIDLSSVVWVDDGRIATYYVEYALPPRSTQIYYDRANTCFTRLSAAEINWDYLTDTRILHLSGLTVPLSPNLPEIITDVIRYAKSRNVQVSFDVNYRRRIWSPAQARKILLPIFEEVDILFCSRSDASTVLGIEGEPEIVAQRLGEVSGAHYIITSLSSEGMVGWDRDQLRRQPACNVYVIDRIGAGDAMVAGVLHGLLQGDFAVGLRYGAVTAGLALSQYGDQVVTTREEVEELARPRTSTDIYR